MFLIVRFWSDSFWRLRVSKQIIFPNISDLQRFFFSRETVDVSSTSKRVLKNNIDLESGESSYKTTQIDILASFHILTEMD